MTLKTLSLAVGAVLFAAGIGMIPCALIGLVENDSTALPFASVGIPSLIIGWLLCRGTQDRIARTRPSVFAVVGVGAVVAIGVSAIPYLLWGTGLINAIFESTSGWTTTGATCFSKVEELPASILLWRATTQWLGGLGILVAVIVLLPTLEPDRVLLLSATDFSGGHKFRPRMNELGRDILLMYGLFTGLNAILLYLGDLSPLASVCIAFSTISTGGFSTVTSGLPQNSGLYVEVITIVFMLIGATNFLLHVRIFRGESWAHFKSGLFRLFLWLMLCVGLLVMLDAVVTGGFWESLRRSLFATVSFATTTGFRASEPGLWSPHARTIFLLVVFIGGMMGSTAGGIKVQRLWIILRASWLEVMRLLYPNRVRTPRVEGEAVAASSVERALMMITAWMLLFSGGALILLIYSPDMETALSTSAAAINNVGASFGSTADGWGGLAAGPKIAMALLMFAGRLEIFALLAATAPYVWRKPLKLN